MAFGLTISKDDITPVLKKIEAAAANPYVAVEAGASLIVTMGRRAFDEAGMRPAPWPPHSQRHASRRAAKERKKLAKQKKKSKPVVRLLYDTGNLMDSVARGNPVQNSPFSASVIVPPVYAAAHQFGSPKKGIPARPFLPLKPDGTLTDAALANVTKAVEIRIRKMMGG